VSERTDAILRSTVYLNRKLNSSPGLSIPARYAAARTEAAGDEMASERSEPACCGRKEGRAVAREDA